MASSSDDEKALLEAARDTDIPDAGDEMCWPALRVFLKCNRVDVAARNRDEWLKSFNRYRRAFEKSEKGFLAERSPSTGSEKISDVGSVVDSVCGSSSPYDNVCYALLF
jgi:hypothetical protein